LRLTATNVVEGNMQAARTMRASLLSGSANRREHETDAVLLRRIAATDRHAVAELYARHQRALFRYLCQLTPDSGLAEEILQDTIVAAWQGAASFEGRSTVQTWLFAVARRQAHNALRRRGLPPFADEDALDVVVDPEPGPEERALQQSDVVELGRAMSGLSLLHREVLVLNFLHGLSYEEIATVVDVPIGTVKSRLSNAKRALREVLLAGSADDRSVPHTDAGAKGASR
jgi:RNA polymerase sigma-70 factor (ECF subfamily)